jgi:hypothetical protein
MEDVTSSPLSSNVVFRSDMFLSPGGKGVRLDPSDTDLRREFELALAYIQSASDLVDQLALLLHYLKNHVPYDLEQNKLFTRELKSKLEGDLSRNAKYKELVETQQWSYKIVRMAQLGEILKNRAAVCLEKAMFGQLLLAELGIKSGLRYGRAHEAHEWLELDVQIEEGLFVPEKTRLDPTTGSVGNFVNTGFDELGPAQFLVKPTKGRKKSKDELERLLKDLASKYDRLDKTPLPQELLSRAEKALLGHVSTSFSSSTTLLVQEGGPLSIGLPTPSLPVSKNCAHLFCDNRLRSEQMARFCPTCEDYRCASHHGPCASCGGPTRIAPFP